MIPVCTWPDGWKLVRYRKPVPTSGGNFIEDEELVKMKAASKLAGVEPQFSWSDAYSFELVLLDENGIWKETIIAVLDDAWECEISSHGLERANEHLTQITRKNWGFIQQCRKSGLDIEFNASFSIPQVYSNDSTWLRTISSFRHRTGDVPALRSDLRNVVTEVETSGKWVEEQILQLLWEIWEPPDVPEGTLMLGGGAQADGPPFEVTLHLATRKWHVKSYFTGKEATSSDLSVALAGAQAIYIDEDDGHILEEHGDPPAFDPVWQVYLLLGETPPVLGSADDDLVRAAYPS